MVARAKNFSFWKRLQEIGMFFEGKGPEHKTLRRLVKRLEKADIPYAVMGAMAVNAHRHERTTKDVDVLVTSRGFAEFCRRFVPKFYEQQEGRPRRMRDRKSQVTIDFLITGHYPGSGKPGPIAFPDPEMVSEVIQDARVVDLPTLIQLKLAARRHYDFGDVAHLVAIHDLDESYLAKLHPSVHPDFIECLEEKRREDEYEKTQDRAVEEMMKNMPKKPKYPKEKR